MTGETFLCQLHISKPDGSQSGGNTSIEYFSRICIMAVCYFTVLFNLWPPPPHDSRWMVMIVVYSQ